MVDGTLLSALLLVLGAGALFGGAELLVKGAGNLALGLGLRAATVGVTVIAFATTAPELFVAILGALDVSSDVGFGTVVGSNIANIALVLGVSALIRPLSISDAMMRRHVPFMVLAAVLLPVLALDGQIGKLEGGILLAVLAAFTGYLLHTVNSSPAAAEMPDGGRNGVVPRDVAFVLAGLVTLLVGSRWLISGGSSLLLAMGVSEFVVGMTVLALGTSLPELAASAVGAARGETEFTVGNVVGSNIYNIVAVLGLLAVAVPISVTDSVLRFELPLVVAFTLVLVGMMWRGRRLTRIDGAVLVVSYVVFVRFLFV